MTSPILPSKTLPLTLALTLLSSAAASGAPTTEAKRLTPSSTFDAGFRRRLQRAAVQLRRHLRILLAAVIPAVFFSPAQAVAKTGASRLAGEYRHSGGKADLKARDAAIDQVAAKFNFLVRGIVRSRLKKGSAICPTIKLIRKGKEITVVMGSKRFTAPFNGKAVFITNRKGKRAKLTHRGSVNRLVQTVQGPNGSRQRVFVVGSDGRLVLTVTLSSKRMPKSLRYRLHYRRGPRTP